MTVRQLLVLVTFFAAFNGNAQAYMKPRVIGTVDLGGCTNEVVLELFNMPSDAIVAFDDVSLQPVNMVSDGDTISNVCVTHPNVQNSTNDYFYMGTTNGYLTHASVLYSSAITPHFNFSVVNYVEPTGGYYDPLSADGELTLEFDSATVLGAGYTLYAFQDQGDVTNITYPNANTVTFSNVSQGWMTLFMPSLSDTTDHLETRFYFGNPNEVYINTGLNMALSMQHADNNCIGWVNATPTNATGNILTIWDNQVYNTSTQYGLCPGLYSVYTYELDVQTAQYVAGSIDTFIVTNSNTTYIDSSIYQNVPQDTVYLNFENCTFNYTAPIDTLTYTEDTVFQGGGITILAFEMNLQQDSTFFTIADTLTLLNDSIIQLDVAIWCDSTINKTSSFNGRRVVFLRGVDNHSFSQGTAAVKEVEVEEVMVYPNPVEDELIVSFSESSDSEVSLVNSLGQIVWSVVQMEKEMKIDVSGLSPGIYLLNVSSDSVRETFRIVKN